MHFKSYISLGSVAVYYLILHPEAFTKCHTECVSNWACCRNCVWTELQRQKWIENTRDRRFCFALHNNPLVMPLSLLTMLALVYYVLKCKLLRPQHYLSPSFAIPVYMLMEDGVCVHCTENCAVLGMEQFRGLAYQFDIRKDTRCDRNHGSNLSMWRDKYLYSWRITSMFTIYVIKWKLFPAFLKVFTF